MNFRLVIDNGVLDTDDVIIEVGTGPSRSQNTPHSGQPDQDDMLDAPGSQVGDQVRRAEAVGLQLSQDNLILTSPAALGREDLGDGKVRMVRVRGRILEGAAGLQLGNPLGQLVVRRHEGVGV